MKELEEENEVQEEEHSHKCTCISLKQKQLTTEATQSSQHRQKVSMWRRIKNWNITRDPCMFGSDSETRSRRVRKR